MMSLGLLVKVFGCLAAALWLVSAVFWVLQRAGHLNAWAVGIACAAVLASAVTAVCDGAKQ
jgi:hypothetical protein